MARDFPTRAVTRRPRRLRLGSALVELALTAPLLLLLLAGVLDYGRALTKATAVANAARIAAQYGSSSSTRSDDTAGMRAAAINSAPSFSALTVSSSKLCQCPGAIAVACNGTCSMGKMLTYVQVTVHSTSSAVFRYSGLPYTGAIESVATMRAQ